MYSFISRFSSIIDLCVYLHANTPGSSAGKRMHLQHRRPWFDSWVGKIPCRRDGLPTPVFLGSPCSSAGKESSCNAGDLGSIPGLGRAPEERKGYPLQDSDLENSMDCIVHGLTKSSTWLSDFQCERSKTQKANDDKIPCMWNVQNWKYRQEVY